MVEVDPTSDRRTAVKHTALGRFRHEAVAVRAEAGKPLQVIQAVTAAAGTSISLSVLRASKRSPTSAIHGCLRPVSCRWHASMPMAAVNGWR